MLSSSLIITQIAMELYLNQLYCVLEQAVPVKQSLFHKKKKLQICTPYALQHPQRLDVLTWADTGRCRLYLVWPRTSLCGQLSKGGRQANLLEWRTARLIINTTRDTLLVFNHCLFGGPVQWSQSKLPASYSTLKGPYPTLFLWCIFSLPELH